MSRNKLFFTSFYVIIKSFIFHQLISNKIEMISVQKMNTKRRVIHQCKFSLSLDVRENLFSFGIQFWNNLCILCLQMFTHSHRLLTNTHLHIHRHTRWSSESTWTVIKVSKHQNGICLLFELLEQRKKMPQNIFDFVVLFECNSKMKVKRNRTLLMLN